MSYTKNYYATELVRIEEALKSAPKSRHHQTKSSSSDSEEELDSESDPESGSESELESDSDAEEGESDGDKDNSDDEYSSTNSISSVEVVEQREIPKCNIGLFLTEGTKEYKTRLIKKRPHEMKW